MGKESEAFYVVDIKSNPIHNFFLVWRTQRSFSAAVHHLNRCHCQLKWIFFCRWKKNWKKEIEKIDSPIHSGVVVLVVRVTPHTLKNQHIQLYSTLTNNPYALLDDFQFDSLGKFLSLSLCTMLRLYGLVLRRWWFMKMHFICFGSQNKERSLNDNQKGMNYSMCVT